MKRKWWLMILIVLLAVAAIGYALFNKTTPDAVQLQPDVVITAAAFIYAFEQNSTAANEQYNGKVIQVSGVVKSTGASGAVVLGTEESTSEIVVGLAEQYVADAHRLKPGMQATLQGFYSGYQSAAAGDLLAALGTTVQLRSGGVIGE